MAWMMSGNRAKRHVLVWRGAAAGLGLFAATLWAVQTPLVSPNVHVPEATAPGPSTGSPTEQPTELAHVDPETVSEVATRLDYVIGRERKGKAPKDPKEPPPPSPLGAWKYLGSITEPGRKLAIISVEGKQAAIPEGMALNGITLVEVKPGAIIVDDGTNRLEVPREAKTGPSVAWVMPGAAGAGLGGDPARMAEMRGLSGNVAGPAGAVPGQMDPAMAAFTPEEQAQMRERGVDPAQAARMRQRLEKDRSLGRGNRAGTTVTTGDGRIITATPTTPRNKDRADRDDDKPEAPTQ